MLVVLAVARFDRAAGRLTIASTFVRVRLRDGRMPVIWFPGRGAAARVNELNAWLARAA